jgi:uncharacterized caspase-like protein
MRLAHLTLQVLTTVVLAGCTVTAKSPTAAAPSARLALVIGNSAYEGAPPLKNPVNDAADICAALRRLEFEALCHTDVPDRAAFDALVQRFVSRLGPTSVGLFYFSGHGVQVGGANYLVPTRVAANRPPAETVRALYGVEGLLQQLGERKAQLRLVVLDACRTDLFAGATTPAAPGRDAALSRAIRRWRAST